VDIEDVEDDEAALVFTSGHDPILVRRDDDVEHVGDEDHVAAFLLDGQRRLGDHPLEVSLGSFVAGPIGFIGEQIAGVAQVGVEVAGEVVGVAEMDAVVAEDADHGVAERTLAGAALASEHHGDLGALVGLLHHAAVSQCCRSIPTRPIRNCSPSRRWRSGADGNPENKRLPNLNSMTIRCANRGKKR
jgi:hypothetical protein